jgi:hypothetical protein
MDRGGREEKKERKGIAIAKIIAKNNSFLHVDNLELRILEEHYRHHYNFYHFLHVRA